MNIRAQELIVLIRDLDIGLSANSSTDEAGISYLDLQRWNRGGGETDISATRLVRRLAREKLGTFPLEEIGAATLVEIDARGADPA